MKRSIMVFVGILMILGVLVLVPGPAATAATGAQGGRCYLSDEPNEPAPECWINHQGIVYLSEDSNEPAPAE